LGVVSIKALHQRANTTTTLSTRIATRQFRRRRRRLRLQRTPAVGSAHRDALDTGGSIRTIANVLKRYGIEPSPERSKHTKWEFLIIDRDTKYAEQFRRMIGDNGTKVIRLPPRSPNLNAYAERFVRSIREEWLDRNDLRGAGVFASSGVAA
jgi:transposase InsO family protein